MIRKKFVIIPVILVALIAFLSVASAADSSNIEEPLQTTSESTPYAYSAADSSDPPVNTTRIVFIHHSCGSNWLATGNGNLGANLNYNNYYVSDTNYGWDAEANDNLGDHTDTSDWDLWFNDVKMPYVYNTTYHSAYTNFANVTNPGGENEIIMFKSCYPLSEVGSSIDDEKAIYNDLKTYFAAHQDKLFVLITPPGETTVSSYLLTRELCQWLVDNETGWLSDYPGNNVFVFDFYCVLSEVDSHHRLVDGEVEYVYASNYDGISPYHDGDDHPNAAGNQKATAEFLPLLNMAYNQWKSVSQTFDVYVGGSIQTAIDAASANDIIIVHDDEGTSAQYNENLMVNKTLTIMNSGLVTIHASNPGLPVITINSVGNGSTIQGFNINGGSSGIYLDGAGNCTIFNNTINSNTIGILVMGNQNNISTNNASTNGWAGICLSGASQNNVETNLVSDNPEGIYTLNGNNNVFLENYAYNNSVNGITISGGSQNILIHNMIFTNGVSTNGNGVILKDTTLNNLNLNFVLDNGWSGIVLDNSSNNDIMDVGLGGNIISGNGNGLVLFNGCDNNNIEGNSIIGNMYNGLQLFVDCEYNQIVNNAIFDTQVTGLLVQMSDNNNITGNMVNNSFFNGVALDDANANLMDTNMITWSGSIGLVMVNSLSNNILNNIFENTFWSSIALDASSNNLLYNNFINGSSISQNGIWFQGSSNQNNITSNTIMENTDNGIYITGSQNNRIEFNNVLYNGVMGIILSGSNNTTIYRNLFVDNGYVGTCLADGSNSNIITENNYFSSSPTPLQAYDTGSNTYDNGTTGNFWSEWGTTTPRAIAGGGNSVDNHPHTTPF